MNDISIEKDTSLAEVGRLQQIAEDVIRRCRAKGASEADVAASVDEGLSVNVRLGEVETVERTRDRGVSVTVWFGKRERIVRQMYPADGRAGGGAQHLPVEHSGAAHLV